MNTETPIEKGKTVFYYPACRSLWGALKVARSIPEGCSMPVNVRKGGDRRVYIAEHMGNGASIRAVDNGMLAVVVLISDSRLEALIATVKGSQGTAEKIRQLAIWLTQELGTNDLPYTTTADDVSWQYGEDSLHNPPVPLLPYPENTFLPLVPTPYSGFGGDFLPPNFNSPPRIGGNWNNGTDDFIITGFTYSGNTISRQLGEPYTGFLPGSEQNTPFSGGFAETAGTSPYKNLTGICGTLKGREYNLFTVTKTRRKDFYYDWWSGEMAWKFSAWRQGYILSPVGNWMGSIEETEENLSAWPTGERDCQQVISLSWFGVKLADVVKTNLLLDLDLGCLGIVPFGVDAGIGLGMGLGVGGSGGLGISAVEMNLQSNMTRITGVKNA